MDRPSSGERRQSGMHGVSTPSIIVDELVDRHQEEQSPNLHSISNAQPHGNSSRTLNRCLFLRVYVPGRSEILLVHYLELKHVLQTFFLPRKIKPLTAGLRRRVDPPRHFGSWACI